MWSLSLVTAPTAEPLSTDELREHSRIDGEGGSQLGKLGRSIGAARERCEGFTRRQLLTATWKLLMDSWWEEGITRDGALFIPRPPLSSVTHVKYRDEDGTLQTWATSQYVVDAPTGPRAGRGRIVPAYDVDWPTLRCQPNAVEVQFVAGYGAAGSSVPAALLEGILLVAGELYERREDAIVGAVVSPTKVTSESLWWPYRAW